MKRLWMLSCLLVCAIHVSVALIEVDVEAAAPSTGFQCQIAFRMLPFADRLELDFSDINAIDARWIGELPGAQEPSYVLVGGGQAFFHPAAQRFSLSLPVLFNPSPFFDGQPLCRLQASLNTSLQGPWSLECRGISRPPNNLFTTFGTMRPQLCGAPETDLQIARSTGHAIGLSGASNAMKILEDGGGDE